MRPFADRVQSSLLPLLRLLLTILVRIRKVVMSSHLTYWPILAGHTFQQTALISMVPVLAQMLSLREGEIGLAVAAGLVAASIGLPFIGRLGGRVVVMGALGGMMLANLALLLLIGTEAVGLSAGVALIILMVIRSVQGVSAAGLLMAAQHLSTQQRDTRHALGVVHSMGSIGRILSAGLIGPMLLISPLLPLLPATLGAGASLLMFRRTSPPQMQASFKPPNLTAFRVTVLTQMAVGACQIGLAPLIMSRLEGSPAQAAGFAGICLAAANIGLLLALRLLLPRANSTVTRAAALSMIVAGLCVSLANSLFAFVVLSFIIGGCTALLFTLNLSEIMTRKDYAQLQVTGWNGAIQIASLAVGVGLGSALMSLSPAAPFAVVVLSGAALALSPPPT